MTCIPKTNQHSSSIAHCIIVFHVKNLIVSCLGEDRAGDGSQGKVGGDDVVKERIAACFGFWFRFGFHSIL